MNSTKDNKHPSITFKIDIDRDMLLFSILLLFELIIIIHVPTLVSFIFILIQFC